MTNHEDSNLAAIDLDERTGANAVASLVMRGDLSGLGPEDRARYYVAVCEGLGLNPHSQPFAFLRLNGKEVLYATRGCTDQLARIHRVTRTIVDGPKLVDLGGTKLILCVAQASHPNGRVETSTATVPFVDPVNVLMKCETKAKRRVTLSLLGLGMLDEMELETIPASVQEPGGGVDLSRAVERKPDPRDLGPLGIEAPAQPVARPADVVAEVPAVQVDDVPAWQRALDALAESTPTLATYCNAVERAALPGDCVTVWMRRRADLAAMPAPDREAAWKALALRCEAVGHMKNAKVWLKKSIAEADAARAVAPVSSETGAA